MQVKINKQRKKNASVSDEPISFLCVSVIGEPTTNTGAAFTSLMLLVALEKVGKKTKKKSGSIVNRCGCQ